MYSVSLSKTNSVWLGGVPNKACHSFEQSILPSNGRLSSPVGLAVIFYPAAWRTRCDGQVDVAMSSVLGPTGIVAPRSIHLSSSSSTVLPGNPSHLPNVEGVTGWVHTFTPSGRLDPGARDPNDMGLSGHELCPDVP